MALPLWETLKEAISPSTFFTLLSLALALYYAVSGFSSDAHPRRPREEQMEPLPPPVQLGEEELSLYDGKDPDKPHLMAIKGQIYDVSQRSASKQMAAATQLRLPTHPHPLHLVDVRSVSYPSSCDLCGRRLFAEVYTCRELCRYDCHRLCAEAPPSIDNHPLHPAHSLTLIHRQPVFKCSACDDDRYRCSAFRCDDCDFILDLGCALATLLDQGCSPEGTTPEQIVHPLHPHRLTSFSTRNDYVVGDKCNLCRREAERDVYACLRHSCRFLIHKRCVKDLHYADGTKAPRIYHDHQLEIFLGEDTGSRKCAYCGSGKSGELIGCSSCRIFHHRNCIQGPEILHYPPHQHNSLVLFIYPLDDPYQECKSCFSSTKGELCYSCHSCDFRVHMGCALQTLAYCEEGMRVSIECFWHQHSLFLCHGTESGSSNCDYCGDKSIGPMYACQGHCRMLLHERCIKIESTISHGHHPDHPLTFATRVERYPLPGCMVCQEGVRFFNFSCDVCAFYLHSRCANRVPTVKHCLHEHKLLHLDEAPSVKCNRCSTHTNTPLFRCVQCDFNIHEKCAELPEVVKSDIHWHPLALHESYTEDDSGEYYCDHCEKRRDARLGAYVCGECSARWAYHIECVLPELQIFFGNKSKTLEVEALGEQIKRQNERVLEAEVEVEKRKQVLDELKKKLEKLISIP